MVQEKEQGTLGNDDKVAPIEAKIFKMVTLYPKKDMFIKMDADTPGIKDIKTIEIHVGQIRR